MDAQTLMHAVQTALAAPVAAIVTAAVLLGLAALASLRS